MLRRTVLLLLVAIILIGLTISDASAQQVTFKVMILWMGEVPDDEAILSFRITTSMNDEEQLEFLWTDGENSIWGVTFTPTLGAAFWSIWEPEDDGEDFEWFENFPIVDDIDYEEVNWGFIHLDP